MDQSQVHAVQAMLVFMPFLVLGFSILFVIPYWFIWKKAGFSPWFSLLMFIPIVNLVMLYVLAFSEWRVAPVTPIAPPYPYPPSTLPPQI